MIRVEFLTSIAEIDPGCWNGLFEGDNPFIRFEFLHALEQSQCVSSDTGWQPQHIVIYKDDEVMAAMPLYLKSHSYGEFVFDWGWAEAYERHGLDYYPKLLTAIPFTPSTGPRIGVAEGVNRRDAISVIFEQIQLRASDLGISGWNILFPDAELLADLEGLEAVGTQSCDLLRREDVQFHWFNRSYKDFDDYLLALRSSRRKNMKRERKRVRDQGISVTRKTGSDISEEDWQVFYRCYCETYLKRSGHPGYLDRNFFNLLLESMGDSLMLVIASLEGEAVACSLFLYDSKRLYGRYWGSLTDIDCLHFEACFYQGIEFCIENSIAEFDPGTQGEHKLLRGFEPCTTYSCHWIADPRFSQAIEQFLDSEKTTKRRYSEQATAFLPFRRDQG